MTWLAPIGFLGLIGLILLIVIYIIKPNYEKKMVSSTHVWKLSLKYRKKRLPISRLNNVLTFLCQFLILTICGLLLAQPVIEHEKRGDENEKIIIIDASASMRVSDGAYTRFERAVQEAKLLVEETFEQGGVVSVILANSEPQFLVQRNGNNQADDVLAALDALTEGENKCTYSAGDMNAAVGLTEEVLRYNPDAQVFLYTGTTYLEKNGINVIDISKSQEWNAAILNCSADLNEENHYEITIDVGCYKYDGNIDIYCEIYGANGVGKKLSLPTRSEYFDPTEEEKVITFAEDDFGGEYLYSFDYIEVYVAVEDSFTEDNSFFLYGGTKPTIRVQYASSLPNNYFGGVVRTMRQMMKDKWNIEFKELKADEKAATEGFDLYIFEHKMPTVMPTDGLVLLVDPHSSPEGAGIAFGNILNTPNPETTLASGLSHELTKYVDSARITIARYVEVISADGYEELAYYNGQPVILAKDEPEAKVVVWAFDLNYSNLCAMPDFSFLMYNMFNHYIPTTIPSNAFEIGDTVELNARGSDLKVVGNGIDYAMEGKTGSITVTRPGTYTVTQMPMSGEELLIENFYVRIPQEQSNLTRQVDALPSSDVEVETRIEFEDLLFYFAIALVSLLFIEWALQIKKNF